MTKNLLAAAQILQLNFIGTIQFCWLYKIGFRILSFSIFSGIFYKLSAKRKRKIFNSFWVERHRPGPRAQGNQPRAGCLRPRCAFCAETPADLVNCLRGLSTIPPSYWQLHIGPLVSFHLQTLVHALTTTNANHPQPRPIGGDHLRWSRAYQRDPHGLLTISPKLIDPKQPRASLATTTTDRRALVSWFEASSTVEFNPRSQRVPATLRAYGAHRSSLGEATVWLIDVDTALGGVHRITKRCSE
jgi:hypothetical protein